uniref:Large ribosomal subunit protein P2 n=1 Tax=Leptobrachium leishanense TaxID=445787 RepID=A0A8C5PEU9_9ANUR
MKQNSTRRKTNSNALVHRGEQFSTLCWMRYISAYLLAVLGGNDKPSVKDLKKILDSVGIETDDACAQKVVSELNGKSINEVIAQGNTKLACMPSGGAVPLAASGGSGAPAAAAAAAPVEEKKEEKEESEESDEGETLENFEK